MIYAAGVLAPVFVATAALWGRSYTTSDCLALHGKDRGAFAETLVGRLRLEATRRTWGSSAATAFFKYERRQPFDGMMMNPGEVYFDRFGFKLVIGDRWGDYHYSVLIPFWFLLLIEGAIAAYLLRRFALRGRGSDRSCYICGYDLRATPERCPECGRIPARTSMT